VIAKSGCQSNIRYLDLVLVLDHIALHRGEGRGGPGARRGTLQPGMLQCLLDRYPLLRVHFHHLAYEVFGCKGMSSSSSIVYKWRER
jgi:hypothetical protein